MRDGSIAGTGYPIALGYLYANKHLALKPPRWPDGLTNIENGYTEPTVPNCLYSILKQPQISAKLTNYLWEKTTSDCSKVWNIPAHGSLVLATATLQEQREERESMVLADSSGSKS